MVGFATSQLHIPSGCSSSSPKSRIRSGILGLLCVMSSRKLSPSNLALHLSKYTPPFAQVHRLDHRSVGGESSRYFPADQSHRRSDHGDLLASIDRSDYRTIPVYAAVVLGCVHLSDVHPACGGLCRPHGLRRGHSRRSGRVRTRRTRRSRAPAPRQAPTWPVLRVFASSFHSVLRRPVRRCCPVFSRRYRFLLPPSVPASLNNQRYNYSHARLLLVPARACVCAFAAAGGVSAASGTVPALSATSERTPPGSVRRTLSRMAFCWVAGSARRCLPRMPGRMLRRWRRTPLLRVRRPASLRWSPPRSLPPRMSTGSGVPPAPPTGRRLPRTCASFAPVGVSSRFPHPSAGFLRGPGRSRSSILPRRQVLSASSSTAIEASATAWSAAVQVEALDQAGRRIPWPPAGAPRVSLAGSRFDSGRQRFEVLDSASRSLFLVEGPLSALAAPALFPELATGWTVVGVAGWAGFRRQAVGAARVVRVCPDGDTDGQRAVQRFVDDLVASGMEVWVDPVPPGVDLLDLYRTGGPLGPPERVLPDTERYAPPVEDVFLDAP